MLRKHLEHLEHPVESEVDAERDQSVTPPREEDTSYPENGMHEISSVPLNLLIVFLHVGWLVVFT